MAGLDPIGSGNRYGARTRRARIWVVDDVARDAEAARRALEPDHDVLVLRDGSDVLERLAAQSPPDLLVLDWVMPGVTGIEVVRFLRTEAELPQVPVLLMTAHNVPDQVAAGLSAGANDFLAKPFNAIELRSRCEALLRTARLIERAREAERNVAVLLENAPDALLSVDASGKLVFVNTEAQRVFGKTADQLLGAPLADLVPGLPAHNINIEQGHGLFPIPDVTIGERTYGVSVRLMPSDTAAATTIALRDVTQRRQLDRKRLDFYAIIAHDLRSPLQSVMLRTGLILSGQRGPVSPEISSDISVIDRNIRAMVEMINDFLELARLEGTGLKISTSEFDLCEVAASAINDLRPLAESHGLHIEWCPPAKPAFVRADRSRLNQVFANLLGNAIKFTQPGGQVTVAIAQSDNEVRATVSDTGPGIPRETIPHLFDRYKRMPSHRHILGSGLGLTIVREIVEAHGGTVGADSQLGEGSAFWFEIPRGEGAPEN